MIPRRKPSHPWRVILCVAEHAGNRLQPKVFLISLITPGVSGCEVAVTDELRRVRDWASDQIRAGGAQGSSWYQYVKLIEATDAILHDVQIVENSRAAATQQFEGEGRRQKVHAIRGGRRH